MPAPCRLEFSLDETAGRRRQNFIYGLDIGDLATRVVGMLGDLAGSDKVLYIDPLKSPVGLNPLTLAAGANDNPAGPSIISDAIGYAIRRTFGDHMEDSSHDG